MEFLDEEFKKIESKEERLRACEEILYRELSDKQCIDLLIEIIEKQYLNGKNFKNGFLNQITGFLDTRLPDSSVKISDLEKLKKCFKLTNIMEEYENSLSYFLAMLFGRMSIEEIRDAIKENKLFCITEKGTLINSGNVNLLSLKEKLDIVSMNNNICCVYVYESFLPLERKKYYKMIEGNLDKVDEIDSIFNNNAIDDFEKKHEIENKLCELYKKSSTYTEYEEFKKSSIMEFIKKEINDICNDNTIDESDKKLKIENKLDEVLKIDREWLKWIIEKSGRFYVSGAWSAWSGDKIDPNILNIILLNKYASEISRFDTIALLAWVNKKELGKINFKNLNLLQSDIEIIENERSIHLIRRYVAEQRNFQESNIRENNIEYKEISGNNLNEKVSNVESISDEDDDTEYSEEEKLNLLFDNQEKYTPEDIKNEITRLSGSYMVEGYRTFKNLFSEEEKQEIEEEILEFIEDNSNTIESEKIKEIILSLSNNGIERGYERFGKYLDGKDRGEVQKRLEEIKEEIKGKIKGKNGIIRGIIQSFANLVSKSKE